MKVMISVIGEKLCHARPGDIVIVDNQPYLVCVNDIGNRRMRDGMMHGLYDEQNVLFLVNVESGIARNMPHLSSRVQIVRDAKVVIGELA